MEPEWLNDLGPIYSSLEQNRNRRLEAPEQSL